MTERPILFKREMILARRAGFKSQTRRAFKVQPDAEKMIHWVNYKCWVPDENMIGSLSTSSVQRAHLANPNGYFRCPYGEVGDRLWHRETWGTSARWNYLKPSELPIGITEISYAADFAEDRLDLYKPWRLSLFLPRRYCRWVDEITDIRVERLQDISEEDAIAEGVERSTFDNKNWKCYDGSFTCFDNPRDSYFSLWDSINGKGAALKNPWVWALTLKQVQDA